MTMQSTDNNSNSAAQPASEPPPLNGAAALLDDSIRNHVLVQCGPASKSLRVCCFGSSSIDTPKNYMREAAALGYILARRGHVCVNGAGSCGCMGAINEGADAGQGHIVGVIHEMWLDRRTNRSIESAVTPSDASTITTGQKTPPLLSADIVSRPLRDGGAHSVFHGNVHGPRREMLVATGPDLTERKRMLIDNADAIVVLPGGPGTFDELWEIACARNISLKRGGDKPVVLVNVDNYYQPFYDILVRAHRDKLIKREPEEILHFEKSSADAIQWVESILIGGGGGQRQGSNPSLQYDQKDQNHIRKALRKSSYLGGGSLQVPSANGGWWDQTKYWASHSWSSAGASTDEVLGDKRDHIQPESSDDSSWSVSHSIMFAVGLAAGILVTTVASRQRQSSSRLQW